MPEHQPVSSVGNRPVAVIGDLRIGSANTNDATAYQDCAVRKRRIGHVNDTSRAGVSRYDADCAHGGLS